jgi:hypothetical protein
MDTLVLVIDVPITMSAEDAARRLSEPVTRGYPMRGMTAGEPMRVVFAPYAATENKCEDELRAMELVVAHRQDGLADRPDVVRAGHLSRNELG